jgi:serine protease Do
MKMVTIIACLLGSIAAANAGDPPSPTELAVAEDAALHAAARNVAASVVRVETVASDASAENKSAGPTSGVIVTPEGHIITSGYSFAEKEKPTSILVTLADGKRHAGQLLARDTARNLVLLKITAAEKLRAVEPTPADSIAAGAWSVAVGRTLNAADVNISVGIISAVGRIWGRAIQTDAKISAHNYGGALVDVRGRVIGILTPLSPTETGPSAGSEWYDSGIGFAVPLADVLAVLPKLQAGQDQRAGLAGVNFSAANHYVDPPVIAACRANSPAAKAGLKPGDRIIEAHGKAVQTLAQFRHAIGPLYAGDPLKLVVIRDDKRLPVELELVGQLPPFEHPFLGVLPFRDPQEGLFVRFVFPGSPADKAGIQPGDRIDSLGDKEVNSVKAAVNLLNSRQIGESLTVAVTRGGKRHELSAPLTTLPTSLPADMPPPRRTNIDKKTDIEKGIVPVRVPEFKNQAQALIPATYDSIAPAALVLLLINPASRNTENSLDRWRQAADKYGLIVMAVRSGDRNAWQPGEEEFVSKAAATLAAKYRIDPFRVVAMGDGPAGTMAYQVAFAHRGLIRGVVAVDAPLPPLAEPPDNDPAARLAVLAARSSGARGGSRIETGLKKLSELKYPVTTIELGPNPRTLTVKELSATAQWIDTLDRF